MAFSKSILILSLFLTAAPLSVFASPHLARNNLNHHHRIAARVPAPVDGPSVTSTPRKRATGKRCRPRSSSVATPTSSPVAPTTNKAVANVAPTPKADDEPSTTKKANTTKPANTSTPEAEKPKPNTKVDTPAHSPSSSPEKVPPKAPSPSPSPSPEKSTTSVNKPANTPAPPKTTSTTPAPKPTPKESDNNSSGGGSNIFGSFFAGTQTGEGTFYNTGLTACGNTNKDTDFICAVSQHLFDNVPGATGNPNNNPVCGKKIRATYQGKSVTVTVTDRCVGCAATDLDFSPAAFEKLADFAVGRLQGVTWTWA